MAGEWQHAQAAAGIFGLEAHALEEGDRNGDWLQRMLVAACKRWGQSQTGMARILAQKDQQHQVWNN